MKNKEYIKSSVNILLAALLISVSMAVVFFLIGTIIRDYLYGFHLSRMSLIILGGIGLIVLGIYKVGIMRPKWDTPKKKKGTKEKKLNRDQLNEKSTDKKSTPVNESKKNQRVTLFLRKQFSPFKISTALLTMFFVVILISILYDIFVAYVVFRT